MTLGRLSLLDRNDVCRLMKARSRRVHHCLLYLCKPSRDILATINLNCGPSASSTAATSGAVGMVSGRPLVYELEVNVSERSWFSSFRIALTPLTSLPERNGPFGISGVISVSSRSACHREAYIPGPDMSPVSARLAPCISLITACILALDSSPSVAKCLECASTLLRTTLRWVSVSLLNASWSLCSILPALLV